MRSTKSEIKLPSRFSLNVDEKNISPLKTSIKKESYLSRIKTSEYMASKWQKQIPQMKKFEQSEIELLKKEIKCLQNEVKEIKQN